MKRLFVLLFWTPFLTAHAQNDMFGNSGVTSSTGFRDARDISGKQIPSGAQAGIEGSPMLTEEFVNGVVKLRGNEKAFNLLVNFSLFDNQLLFKRENETLKFATPLDNFSLILKEKDAQKVMNFKNGFPAVGNNDENTFYQVLYEGPKIQLLKFIYKTIREKYSYGGPTQKEYVAKDKLFAYDVANKMITEVTPSVNSLEKALPNYTVSIDRFAAENKIKKEGDIINLIVSLNNEPSKAKKK